jgi:hypothetical protein
MKRAKVSDYRVKTNVTDYLNNVRCEAGRHFRNKKREYRKSKINALQTHSKIKKLETFMGASVNLRRVTTPELIQ